MARSKRSTYATKKLDRVCNVTRSNRITTPVITHPYNLRSNQHNCVANPAKHKRLTIIDKETQIKFLIDSGADISVLPSEYAGNKTKSNTSFLLAANGTRIATYGKKLLNISLGLKRSFVWQFTIADVDSAIIGADFLYNFNILIDIKNKRLIDNDTLECTECTICTFNSPELRMITLEEPYNHIICKFPGITNIETRAPTASTTTHHILTKGPPVHAKARQLPPEKLAAAKKEFALMTKLGICRPSDSPWSSPLHMVKKANGSWRPCGDYRALNNITIPDRYPLPFIQDVTSILHKKTIFSKIDLQRAYQQIEVNSEDIKKTAIITPFGLFEFTKMTFGLRNAAQTMQRLINNTLAELPYVFAYIDDLLIASSSFEEHLIHIENVLKKLAEQNLAINLEKCEFGQSSLTFLGHNISANGFKPLSSKIEAIQRIPQPKIAKELKSFLATINFYRRFLPNATEYQRLLHKMIPGNKKNDKSKLIWTEECISAFNKCKSEIENTTMLSYPSYNGYLVLQTDASDACVGAVLHQIEDNQARPLGFYSKELTSTQKKYSAYDRELTAIYQAIRHFHHILDGRNFTVYTDQKPLIYAFHQKSDKANPRQIRQLDYIGQYSTDIRHIDGKDNFVADMLSRISQISTQPLTVSPEEIREEQMKDQELQRILDNDATQNILHKINIPGSNHYIFCQVQPNKNPRPFIPAPLRHRIIQQIHNTAHPGRKNTAHLLATRFFWQGIKKNAEEFVKHCITCQQTKILIHNKSPLTAYVPPNQRFEHINLDLIGPLPISHGAKYCLTIIDRYSKWPEAIPIADMTAPTVAEELIKHWIARYGPPLRITSDQGRQFESNLFHELNKIMGTQHLRTSGYHPQSNGIIERFHRTLKSALTANDPENWTEKLPFVLLALRSMYKEELGATPAEMLYGQSLRLPGEFLNESNAITETELVNKWRSIIQNLAPAIQTNWHVKEKPFILKNLNTCTHAFIRNDKIKAALIAPYEGPYEIKKRHDKYFELLINGKIIKTSTDRLKPAYHSSNSDIIYDNNQQSTSNIEQTPSESRSSPAPPPTTAQQNSTPRTTKSGRTIRFPIRYQ